MSRVASPKFIKIPDGHLEANPFAGRAQPVIRYAIIAFPFGSKTKIGEAERCEHHPKRFVMRLLDGTRANIEAAWIGSDVDGCVPLVAGMTELWNAHLDATEGGTDA